MFRLTVISGADRGRSFDVDGSTSFVVGRGRDTETRLQDPSVSRRHFEVRVETGNILLRDCGSFGGTLVNSARVEEARLMPGDTIVIGSTQMQVEQPNIEEAGTVPPPGGHAAFQEGEGSDWSDDETTFEMDSPTAAPNRSVDKELTADPSELSYLMGKRVDSYRIVRQLSVGKTGVLFLADDELRQKQVAVKVMWPHFCTRQSDRRRFKEAMRSTYTLSHPNIVRIYKAGATRKNDHQGQKPICWFAMEYVPGLSFGHIMKRTGAAGMLDWTVAHRTALQIAAGLEYAHSRGVVHRNVSPDNILLSKEAVAKLSDLMIARAVTMTTQITKPGELIGEVAFMPPERTTGQATLDCRSDIYSLGATLYSVVTGNAPFGDVSLRNMLDRIQNEDPVPPRAYQLSINDYFEGVILKMMAKCPDDRYQTATELIEDLNRVKQFVG